MKANKAPLSVELPVSSPERCAVQTWGIVPGHTGPKAELGASSWSVLETLEGGIAFHFSSSGKLLPHVGRGMLWRAT